MTAYVVDENVPIVANDSSRQEPKAPQADVDCRSACVQALKRVVRSGVLFIDSAGEVVENYRKHLDFRGQPGVGDLFYRHVMDHKYNRRKVRRVDVSRDADGRFEALPAALANFDPADQVFVAIALVAPEQPQILNAVDSDYAEHTATLEGIGVFVIELCPNCLKGARRSLEGRKPSAPKNSLPRVRQAARAFQQFKWQEGKTGKLGHGALDLGL